MFITDKLLVDFFIGVTTLVIAACFYIRHKYSYWTKKGIPQIPPTFPFGNHAKSLPKGISLGAQSLTLYKEFKKQGHKIGGVYLGLDPYLVITDATYARNILVKDFSHFVDRGIFYSEKSPITVNILTQRGEEWKAARAKLTSIFTSAKMKYFFSTIKKCSDELKTNLEIIAKDENTDVDIYEVMACYFTDVIGSVTYGVDANSFKSPDATFRKLGRELFGSFTIPFQMSLFLTICYPKFAKLTKIGGSIQPEIENFFNEFVPETLENRIKNNIYRADFLQLFIELRNSGVDITNDEIIAQTFTFFSAGFETSSATSMFLLYELSKNKDIQHRLRIEINQVLTKYGELTYEAVQDMTYLSQVFNETIRKYPLLTTLIRVCVKDYQFPDTDAVIEKGTGVILPILGYHRESNLFPDPEKFDPDRFEDKNVKYEGYFPFGDGPRNCIGARFGILQVKLGVAQVIGNFEVTLSPKVKKEELEFDPLTFVTKMTEKVFLRFKKIK